jgi:hypothetical protein
MGFEGTGEAKADSCTEDDTKMGVMFDEGLFDFFRKASP